MATFINEDSNRFSKYEAETKIDKIKLEYEALLKYAGANIFGSSTMDYEDYKAASSVVEICNNYIELEKIKIKAFGKIINDLDAIDRRLDELEEVIIKLK